MQGDILAWLRENIERLKQKSPKFFSVWSKINKVILLIAGIPTLLNWIQQFFEFDINVILPGSGIRIILKIVAFASAWGLMMNNLTVQGGHEIVVDKESGTVVQKPSEKLPFTEKKEEPKIVTIVEK